MKVLKVDSLMVVPYFVCALSLLFCTSFAWAECQVELGASDGALYDNMGRSIAISADNILLGAPFDDNPSANAGSAYVFQRNGSNWTEAQKLLASDGGTDDRFGYAVGIAGDLAIIGAAGDDDKGTNSGSAYIFRKVGSSWVEEQKLLASDGTTLDYFGAAVAISGQSVIIGAYNDGNMGSMPGHGAAYIYRFNGTSWIEERKLTASDMTMGDMFGFAVALSGDVALVGAYQDQDNGILSGSAYIFRRNGSNWVQMPKILPSNGAAYSAFGSAVALKDNLAAIGAYQQDDARGSNFGSVYAFRFNGSIWAQEAELVGADSLTNEKFGFSVSVGNDVVVIGAPNAGRQPNLNDGYGAAYVFRKTGSNWAQTEKLLGADSARYDYFGEVVSVFDDTVLVGAWGHGHVIYQTGAAYIFNSCSTPTISSSSPPNGFVDPLEDRDASNQNTLYGIQNVSITFSVAVTPVGGGSLNASNFITRCVKNGVTASDLQTGAVPAVTQVTGSGVGPYQLQLSSRICLGAWTEIKVINVVGPGNTPISSTGDRIVLGALPMDITQDGKVLGDDINRWLSVSGGSFDPAPLTKVLLLDQKRNGIIAGEDITRSIQLITGIGTFRAWNSFDLGQKP